MVIQPPYEDYANIKYEKHFECVHTTIHDKHAEYQPKIEEFIIPVGDYASTIRFYTNNHGYSN